MLVWAPSAMAGNFTVNSLGDTPDVVGNNVCADAGGQCTLRAAFQEAASAGDDQIGFSVTGTINTACSLQNLNNGLTTITGPGADKLTIRRSGGICSLIVLNGT